MSHDYNHDLDDVFFESDGGQVRLNATSSQLLGDLRTLTAALERFEQHRRRSTVS